MTKVLVLTYHYPPCAYGCSIRVFNFTKFLPQLGFSPVVLTVEPEYYKDYSAEDSSQPQIPPGITVVRTGSLEPKTKIGSGFTAQNQTDTPHGLAKIKSKIISLVQRIGSSLLIPDVQLLWVSSAVKSGRKLLSSPDIKIIYAVAPFFSVFLAAYRLKKLTGKLLVLDFKDMWVGRDQHEHKNFLCSLLSKPLEKMVVRAADKVILTTDYSYRRFLERYPDQKSKFLVIPNGYEPQIEEIAKNSPIESKEPGQFRIIHTGTVETDRNPEAFISAVCQLKDEQTEFAKNIKVCFSGKVHHSYINLIKELGMEDIFVFRGYLDYRENISFLNSASVLLLLTTHGAPDAVPGKLYEYFALKKPVLAITEDGATKDLLVSLGGGEVVHPHDKDSIKNAIYSLYQDFSQGKLAAPAIPLNKFNRQHQAGELAEVFRQLVPGPGQV